MKIHDKEILVTKCEMKKSKKETAYLLIEFLDIESGDNFNVASTNIEFMNVIKPMTKYKANLILNSTKYGLKMDLDGISKEIGHL